MYKLIKAFLKYNSALYINSACPFLIYHNLTFDFKPYSSAYLDYCFDIISYLFYTINNVLHYTSKKLIFFYKSLNFPKKRERDLKN